MTDNPLETLMLPFETGAIAPDGAALLLNAGWHPALRAFDHIVAVQPFRPAAAILESSGIETRPDLPHGPFDCVIVAVPKQVEEAKCLLASGLARLRPGGRIVAGAANDANGNRIAKWMRELGLAPDSLSKHRAQVAWSIKDRQENSLIASEWISAGRARPLDFGGGDSFLTMPGLFSWNRADPGSCLLAEVLPNGLGGIGADFGAGTGFLSRKILGGNIGVSGWHVIEADYRALACARENLPPTRPDCDVRYHWADLTKPVPGLPALDFVVMNPPFHAGKATEASVGQDFIRTAAHHLKKGGRLFLVANAHLPYEHVLAGAFSTHRQLAQQRGFKVIEAIR